ncbi:MAG: hypothetical protein ACXQTI_10670 [Candidatus Nezhaarchaeales archaeon]
MSDFNKSIKKIAKIEKEIEDLEKELREKKCDKMMAYIELMRTPEIRIKYSMALKPIWHEIKQLIKRHK